MPALPVVSEQIIVTASRLSEATAPASAWVMPADRVERLGEPLLPALLRLAPSVAVTVQGPAGLLTEVRIRGAENNHTLLFIDGIRANDPATGDFARFELLNTDLASRVELIRGPQSALWGSQAIGGVVAIFGEDRPGLAATTEAGSFGLIRGSLAAAGDLGPVTLAASIAAQRAEGIDSFSGDGDRDGYRNLSGRIRATIDASPTIELGLSAFALTGRSKFDGYDPLTFDRADTDDESRNRIAAGRAWVTYRPPGGDWRARVAATALQSTNRNFLDDVEGNRTSGSRRSIDAEVEYRFAVGATSHRLILAGETERETFRARDSSFGGATDQERSRSHHSLTMEWQAQIRSFTGDLAVRRDIFNRFKDATTVRASLLADVGRGFSVAGAFAEGIAQPTFFDLYGFFPNSFYGNPSLKPESSRGFEGSLRYRSTRFAASLTAYRQVLHDEIVDVFFPISTTENRDGTSRRRGIEVEAAWNPSPVARVTAHYAFLDADQPVGAAEREDEVRRPRHSGSLAIDGQSGRWGYGASLAFSGQRRDREEVYPYAIVRLKPFVLAGARIAYDLSPSIQFHIRASNLLDAKYEESAGYRTEGRGVFAGVKLADRRSSR